MAEVDHVIALKVREQHEIAGEKGEAVIGGLLCLLA